ncbi:sensor domain-containing diguanylate cyclase [Jeotgalibacillus soli]|uniref:GGDEF domain-containing protein n=1 Tax=Jeotgalibacillus soli TaxID=889306 RepID=A0A0C2V7W5_9BACL|nr:diguanylate cyclase [Jeotgalibacillus soli]KIL45042.1 hypothetical protein KP78_25850 [Jeotgalibacillus soli]
MKTPKLTFMQIYLFIVLLLLALTSIWSYNAFLNLEQESNKIVLDVIPISKAASDLMTQLLNQETGIRGYLVTGDEAFLEPYYAGKEKLYWNLDQIKKHEDQYPIMKQLIEEKVYPQINKIESYYDSQILLIQNGQIEEARSRIDDGKSQLDQFRSIHMEIENDIEKIINDAWEKSRVASERAKNLIVYGGLTVLLVGVMFIYSFRLQRIQTKLVRLSSFDALTKLYNRRMFDEYLEKEWNKAGEEQQVISLLFLDVDNFKLYNDTYGHRQGDHCLRLVASVLRENTMNPQIPARYGGEEFVVILPNTSILEAVQMAESLRIRIKEMHIDHELSNGGYVTVSIGVASMLPQADQTPSILINLADEAMYQAKSEGRNKVIVKEGAA